jgi:hypothetical protein
VISTAVADSPVFWLAIIGGLAALYLLPVVIGAIRHVEGLGWIIVLGLLPLGWPAALVAACMMPRREPAQSYCYWEDADVDQNRGWPRPHPVYAGQALRREDLSR